MKSGLVAGMVVGGLAGMAAGAVAMSKINTPGARRLMRRGKRIFRAYTRDMGF